MPILGGPELARRAQEVRPEIKVLFTSGYAGVLDSGAGAESLPKPYTPRALLRRVRQALDGEAGG